MTLSTRCRTSWQETQSPDSYGDVVLLPRHQVNGRCVAGPRAALLSHRNHQRPSLREPQG